MGPLFSICIPTYNSGALVQYAIESALNQNFNDYEILIVDDCSSDTTFEEVTKYATYDKIRIVKNDTNLGLTANWDRCLNLANGKYIAFLHHDDEYEPTFLSSIYTILKENDSIGIVAVDNQNGKTNEINSGLLSYNSFISTLFTFKYATAPSQCVFVKVPTLHYDLNLKYCPEVDIYLQLLEKKYNVYYLQEKLVKRNVRNWKGNVTTLTRFSTIPFEDKLYIIFKWSNRLVINKKIIEKGLSNLYVQVYKKYSRGLVFNIPNIHDFKNSFNAKVKAYSSFEISPYKMNIIKWNAYLHWSLKWITSTGSKLYNNVKKVS